MADPNVSGANPDPNRIDVSLSLISDQALQAVNKLVAEMETLRNFITSQASPDAVGRAAGMAGVAGRLRAAGEGTGVSHAVSPGAMPPSGPPPLTPSDIDAQQRIQRAQEARQTGNAYMNYVQNGSGSASMAPPTDPAVTRYITQRLGPLQQWRFVRQEAARGMLDPNRPQNQVPHPTEEGATIPRYGLGGGGRLSRMLDRHLELYQPLQNAMVQDQTVEYESGLASSPTGYVTQPSVGHETPPLTIPRAGDFTVQDQARVLLGPNGLPIGGGGGGRPPDGPSSPMGDFGDEPEYIRNLRARGINPESRLGFTIPRLGEFTIQDKLNMASQYFGRKSIRDFEEGDLNSSAWHGRVAGVAGIAAENSAVLTMIQREFDRARAFTRDVQIGPEGLGFSRMDIPGPNVIGTAGFGMRVPWGGVLSEAAREGWRQQWTQRRMQMMPGVSGEEAGNIAELVRGMGFSSTDDMFDLIGRRVLAPLQQQGIAPESAGPLINMAARQGNTDLETLRDTILDLGRNARNAYMSVQDAAEATAEYAETMQQSGGRLQASMQNASAFIGAGIDPRIISQGLQSPLTGGLGTAMTGLPANMLGTVSAAGQASIAQRSIQTSLNLSRGWLNRGDQFMTTASGERIRISTGAQAQRAMAAQLSGFSPEFIERFQRNPNFLQNGVVAREMLQRMQTDIEGRTASRRWHPGREAGGTEGAGFDPGTPGHWETIHRALNDRERQQLEHGPQGDDRIQWNEMSAQLLSMDSSRDWRNRVQQLSKLPMDQRIRRAERMVADATRAHADNQNGIIDMTSETKKYFKWAKVPQSKDRSAPREQANAGGAPSASAYLGPSYPTTRVPVPGGP